MAPCRKIRFIRNQLLYVGDITVSVKDSTGEYKPIQIDRSKATSSSWMRYCDVKDGWGGCKSFTNYRATDNPSVTWTSDGIWTIDLGKTYDNIYVKAKTNSDKIQLLAENDAILLMINIGQVIYKNVQKVQILMGVVVLFILVEIIIHKLHFINMQICFLDFTV